MSNAQLFYSVLPADRLWLPHEIPPKLLIPSKSFVFNFVQGLWTFVAGAGLTVRSTAGVWVTANVNAQCFQSAAGITVTTQGIQVGTSSAATGIMDYCLGSLITHGAGAGNLSYGAVSFVNPYTVGDTAYCALRRNTANLTANTISVAEISWVSVWNTTGGNLPIMHARDVFSPPVAIGAGVTVQFVYTLQITA